MITGIKIVKGSLPANDQQQETLMIDRQDSELCI